MEGGLGLTSILEKMDGYLNALRMSCMLRWLHSTKSLHEIMWRRPRPSPHQYRSGLEDDGVLRITRHS
jgi:hypothetical protein